MSSDSEDSSLDGERQNSRLTNIWKNIQETKNIGRNIERGYPAARSVYDKPRTHHASPQIQPQYKQNLAHLMKKVQQLDIQNSSLQNQIERLRELHHEESSNLKRQFESKLKKHVRRLKTTEKENINVHADLGKTQSLRKEIDRLNLKIKSLEMEKRNLELQNHKLAEIHHQYLAKVQNQTKQSAFQGKGEQLLELEQAHQTIQRLAQLLKRTQEYKSMGIFLQDPRNMHYLKNVLKRFKNNELLIKPIDKKICSCTQAKLVPEKVLWSPTQCYKVLLELKMKYDFLNEDCIQEVLLQMNKLYSSKQQKALLKQKQYYENEITKLKKQAQLGYNDLLTKKQINRLKKQLREAKSVQKSKAPVRIEHLKDKGQLGDQLKLKEREIKLLRQRIRLFQAQNGFSDKVLYYEGTVWALDRILNEFQSNEGGLKEFQLKFRERLDENMQVQDWLRCYKEFFQALQELNGGLVEKLLALKQATLRKMGRLQ